MEQEKQIYRRNTGEDEPQSGRPPGGRKNSVAKEILDWAIALLVAVAIALFLTQVIIVNAQVPTESMEPTIMVGDRVIGLRLSYKFSDPERLDVVIFRYPDDESQLYVKRIIGLPGDTVEVRAGQVYINGSATPLIEPYINDELEMGSFGPFLVPEGHYFVMGDNRANSWDSRYWQNTYVSEEQIVGKAAFRLWPKPGLLD